MIKLLGSVLIAGAAAWLGLTASLHLRRRVRALDEIAGALLLLEQELELSAPDLEHLALRVSRSSRGAGRTLFARFGASLQHLGAYTAAQLWERAVEQQEELALEGRRRLLLLGECLGRFDSREQRACVCAVRARLEQLRQQEEGECRARCRTCHALCLSGGAFLVILLI